MSWGVVPALIGMGGSSLAGLRASPSTPPLLLARSTAHCLGSFACSPSPCCAALHLGSQIVLLIVVQVRGGRALAVATLTGCQRRAPRLMPDLHKGHGSGLKECAHLVGTPWQCWPAPPSIPVPSRSFPFIPGATGMHRGTGGALAPRSFRPTFLLRKERKSGTDGHECRTTDANETQRWKFMLPPSSCWKEWRALPPARAHLAAPLRVPRS